MPTPSPITWPVTVGVDVGQGVANAEFERIDADLFGQHVEHLFLGDHRLRHAEAAEGAGGHAIGEHRPAQRAVMRHDIGTRGMDRHAVGDRRSPGGIGAGVEVALEVHGDEIAVASGRHARAHAGGMALGGRLDRFRPCVDHGAGLMR